MMSVPSFMASNNFFLVPQIVADMKYFDVSAPEILRSLLAPSGKFDLTEEHETKDEYNVDFRVIIRLNINCQSKVPEGWTIALKLHNERVDGIDWESEFTAADGSTGHGWHRHQWNQREQSAKRIKIPAPDFDGIDAREQFLTRALSVMRIRLNARDYGEQLRIDKRDSA
jgi:hypothetical protein